jgi:cytochrome c-type biogenesis protein CcmF
MIFADIDVEKAGKNVGRMSPARFIYTKGGQPTTEVSIMQGLRDDLYVVVGILDPQTKRATLRFHVNPFVMWVWIGVMTLVSGATLSLWPEFKLREVGVWGYLRLATGSATSILLAIVLATSPARASTAVGRDSTSARVPLSVGFPSVDPLALGALGFGLVIGTGGAMRLGRRKSREETPG